MGTGKLLLREIAAYVRHVREEYRMSLFVGNVCRNVPEGAGCLPTMVMGVVLSVLFIWLGVRLADGRASGLSSCTTTCGRFRTPSPRCGHSPALGMSWRCCPTVPPR